MKNTKTPLIIKINIKANINQIHSRIELEIVNLKYQNIIINWKIATKLLKLQNVNFKMLKSILLLQVDQWQHFQKSSPSPKSESNN